MPATFPSIFISATSSDLRSARALVADTLSSLGYQPVWQDIAATDGGVLMNVLEERIQRCDAVLQLVGRRYGAEAPQPSPEFGRVSYTQFEALYGEKVKKKVIYIMLDDQFPTDPCEPEPDDKRQLQEAYRHLLEQKGVLRHSAAGMLQLENHVLRIRDELAKLRAEFERSRRRMWIAACVFFVLLLGLAFGVWKLTRSSLVQQVALTTIQSSQAEEQHSLSDINTGQQKETTIVTRIDTRVQEILALPLQERADRLESALASADITQLQVIQQAHISPREIQTVLARTATGTDKTVADEFFEASIGQPDVIEWLKQEIKDGLNPNLLLPDPYYGQKALLLSALRQSATPAAIALLQNGASPHPYEGLYGTRTETPAFLFPYAAITQSETLSRDDKASLYAALAKAGASFFKVAPISPHAPDDNAPIQATLDSAQSMGVKLEETPALGSGSEPPLAQQFDARDGTHWAQFCHDVPKAYKMVKGTDVSLMGFRLRNFIGSFNGMGYFTVEINHWVPELDKGFPNVVGIHGLLEVSTDQTAWSLYEFEGEDKGSEGQAKNNPGEPPFSNPWELTCWRIYSFVYHPDTKQITCNFSCEYAAQ
jgi:hypothetical protein